MEEEIKTMRVLCSQCGQLSTGVQVSPDYDPARHREFISSAISYVFVFNGEDVDEFLLSPAFTSANGIIGSSTALPDDYPEWIKKLRIECRQCFEGRASADSPPSTPRG
jgi:hypothetical protein